MRQEVLDGSVVKAGISGTWNVLFRIWRSWVRTLVQSHLECVVLLSKLHLNQIYLQFQRHKTITLDLELLELGREGRVHSQKVDHVMTIWNLGCLNLQDMHM